MPLSTWSIAISLLEADVIAHVIPLMMLYLCYSNKCKPVPECFIACHGQHALLLRLL